MFFSKESPLFFYTPKKLVIISDEKITHLTLGKYFQGWMSFFILLAVLWTSFTSFFYVSHQLLVKKAYELVDVQKGKNAVLAEEIKELQTYLSGLTGYIEANPLLKEEVTENKKPNSETEDKSILEENNVESQTLPSVKITKNIQNTVKNRISYITTLLKKTGIDVSVYEDKKSFLQNPFKYSSNKSTNFNHELAYLISLETAINHLPFSMPIAEGNITSVFGKRRDPFSRHVAMHAGIDFAGRRHAKILSTAPGKVIYAGRKGAYGLMVEIDHGKNIHTRYAHLSKIHVKSGGYVKRGEMIGRQGTTGRSTGEHLHYEIRYKNKSYNPEPFLKIGKYVHKKRPEA